MSEHCDDCHVTGESKDKEQRHDTERHAARYESLGEKWYACRGDVTRHLTLDAVYHHAQSQERE